ncbi:serine aminopeptidase domain-containing protein [Gordonia soli]|uniref:Serine aminopeptidase S33 domain-containing protein n=1 Tax=Gordonia soli NBRC 108243 TaxID=1223545 RepID=M0QPY4_9ACTN|nr:alpha/beta hydrolase [Gordonia soli]GAC70306.1 hypothetical protein GS4_33_01220 [Gordonia soli NBRC 108243]
MTDSRPPTVLVSPAMAVPARVYRHLVAAFADVGWSAEVVARRGIDDGSDAPSRRNDWSYADESADLAAAVRRVRADRSGSVIVVGHSLGAQLAIHLAATNPQQPDGIVTVAGSIPHFRHYPWCGVRELAVAEAVVIRTATAGYWPTPGFGAPAPRTLMREWARMVLSGQAPFPVDGRVTTPTLSIRLAGDALVSAPAARHLESAIAAAARTVWTYGDADRPEGGSLDHIRWARTPQPVVARVRDWWVHRENTARARRNESPTAYTMPSTASPIIDA